MLDSAQLASGPSLMAAERPLAGRVALVTGSTSGIGLGIATALAAAGADIVLNGLGDRTEIDRTVERLAAGSGCRVRFEPADLGKPEEINRMLVGVERGLGGVDILVNNAGIQHVSPIESFPPELWDAILALNLSAAFHTIRRVLPGMRDRGWGRIVNVASAHGLVASPFKSAYVAAKHGLVGLTKTVALETAEAGITVNAVCPGYVWTPLVERQIADQAKSHGLPPERVVREVLLKAQPTKRFATVEEMGGVVAFLCSAAAASITGTTIAVDGGWTAH
jgi:3-hydroxybutyrate dehydrogenase